MAARKHGEPSLATSTRTSRDNSPNGHGLSDPRLAAAVASDAMPTRATWITRQRTTVRHIRGLLAAFSGMSRRPSPESSVPPEAIKRKN
jgi:hypothetical protein